MLHSLIQDKFLDSFCIKDPCERAATMHMEQWSTTPWNGAGTSFLTALVVVVLGYGIYRFLYNVYFHPLSKFPGPRLAAATKLPIARAVWTGSHPYWLRDLHEHYQSDIVRISPDELSIISPEVWNDVHSPSKTNGIFLRDHNIYNGPKSLLTVGEADHKRLRRLMNHAFSEKALREQETILNFHVRKLIDKLSEKIPSAQSPGRIDFTVHAMYIVFDIITDLSFGSSFNCQDDSSRHPWVTALSDSVTFVAIAAVAERFPPCEKLLYAFLPKKLAEASLNHQTWTHQEVDRRLSLETERPDLLSYITRNDGDPEKGGMTQEEIYNNANLFLGAGAETTSALVAAAVYFILTHPDYHDRLVKEIRGSFENTEEITVRRIIDRLPFLQAVIDETFRLYPPALGGQPRVVPAEGAWVAGYWIPGETHVQSNQYAMNHYSRHFTEPETFAPERWLDSGEDQKREGGNIWQRNERGAVQPFGAGPKNCIGRNLALAEIRLILTFVLFTFDLSLLDEANKEWTKQRGFMSWERKPLPIGLQFRKDKA